jgi:glycosyltransferase involved in cell wall biosynthesis
MPLISICIPAYKNPEFLMRLLNSIHMQRYKDYEVVITDDTPDDSLKPVVDKFKEVLPLNYIKNKVPLGTPENWNFAISEAKGEWIKLMHNDDWFVSEESLYSFAQVAIDNPNAELIFSGYFEVQDNNVIQKRYVISNADEGLLRISPMNLFKENFIGSPSTTLIKNDHKEWYDQKIKWVVDFEYYIRRLKESTFVAIKKPLINIGIHSNQVTKSSFRKLEVEIPENLYLLEKLGEGSLRNIFVYDYYWRLFRNLKIRNLKQIKEYYDVNLPPKICKMLKLQFEIPLSVLYIGAISKTFMFFSKCFS